VDLGPPHAEEASARVVRTAGATIAAKGCRLEPRIIIVVALPKALRRRGKDDKVLTFKRVKQWRAGDGV
jgi:hypothetical protein